MVEGFKLVRAMTREANEVIEEEAYPGHEQVPTDNEQLIRNWISSNAWGHHASCTCPIGLKSHSTDKNGKDYYAVLDSKVSCVWHEELASRGRFRLSQDSGVLHRPANFHDQSKGGRANHHGCRLDGSPTWRIANRFVVKTGIREIMTSSQLRIRAIRWAIIYLAVVCLGYLIHPPFRQYVQRNWVGFVAVLAAFGLLALFARTQGIERLLRAATPARLTRLALDVGRRLCSLCLSCLLAEPVLAAVYSAALGSGVVGFGIAVGSRLSGSSAHPGSIAGDHGAKSIESVGASGCFALRPGRFGGLSAQCGSAGVYPGELDLVRCWLCRVASGRLSRSAAGTSVVSRVSRSLTNTRRSMTSFSC